MGAVPWTVYAPARRRLSWVLPDGLTWKTVESKVKRLQMLIHIAEPADFVQEHGCFNDAKCS